MPKRGLSRDELIVQLRDQLEFLDVSCREFDAGRENEAKNLAVRVRVICHQNAPSSISLLHHMGVEESIMMRDSVPIYYYSPGPPMAYVFGSGLSTVRPSPTSTRHLPRLRTEPLEEASVNTPFDPWWNLPVIFPRYGERPSRKRIVTWLANKTGGAHIEALPEALSNLLDGSAMGIGFSLNGRPPVLASPMPAAMRQIAEEVRVTLRETFTDELS